MIDFMYNWIMMGVIVLGGGLLCAAVGDNGFESKAGQIVWYGVVGGPLVWLVAGVGYIVLKLKKET